MFNFRWRMSVWLMWLWIKVTPDCSGKYDIMMGIATATIRRPITYPQPAHHQENHHDTTNRNSPYNDSDGC
jgi:hypothetical protein